MKTKKKAVIKEIALQPVDKQSERENDLLGLIVNSPLTLLDKFEKSLELFSNLGVNILAFYPTDLNENTYFLVTNGTVPEIKIFPLYHKICIKQNNTQHFITTSFVNMIELIKGNLSFK